ncbi:MAG: M23 family metallopeptidase [Caulobacteraceae bacterium]|nr:M23 family metallopeptidase [Caulobacteraceae bacterium]
MSGNRQSRHRAVAGLLLLGVCVAGSDRAGSAAHAWPSGHRLPATGGPPWRPVDAASPLDRAIARDLPLPVALEAPADPTASQAEPEPIQIVDGPMEDILYGGAGRAKAGGPVIAQALNLLTYKLDLTRDIALGDRVRLILRRPLPTDGGTEAPLLDYVELDGARGPIRLYRRAETDGFSVEGFADEGGADLRRLLLRTPLASSRITSGFGPRLHPLLGYTRMHQGVDFEAPVGAPVLAAGDGVVESASWAGGFGRLIRLRHEAGMETLYAHLSAFHPGLPPGTRVRQGQVIGWSGASGLATGPHLHFEVHQAGRPIDPAVAKLPAAPLTPGQQLSFLTRKRAVDTLLAGAGTLRR